MRRSNSEIINLLNEFEKTGVSVKEFCITHSIGKATFHKWQSRYKSKPDKQRKRAGFARLHIVPSALHTQPPLFAEVNGIKIYQPVRASYLKEFLP